MGTAGDIDGFSDVLVGGPDFDAPAVDAGLVLIYRGSAPGLSPYFDAFEIGDVAYAYLGLSVSGAGDVSGDGFSDIIVGASGHAAGGSARGRAYVKMGTGGLGTPLLPRQLRANLSAPIATGGAAYEQQFRLGLRLRSPVGRTRAHIQWQLAKLGETFSTATTPTNTNATWWLAMRPGMSRTIPISLPEQPMLSTCGRAHQGIGDSHPASRPPRSEAAASLRGSAPPHPPPAHPVVT